MPQTLAEKIISAKIGREVASGELVLVDADLVYAHDLSGPLALDQLENLGFKAYAYPERVMFFLDHGSPSSTVTSANDHRRIREFARDTNAPLHDVGDGICHQIVLERYAKPGDIILGGDSHTCHGGTVGALATGMGSTDIAAAMYLGQTWLKVPGTLRFVLSGEIPAAVTSKDMMLHIIARIGSGGATYRSMEFVGPTIDAMPVTDRVVFPNMAVEAGAKCGLCPADDRTREYLALQGRAQDYQPLAGDPDAEYLETHDIDVSALEPQICIPHNVDRSVGVTDKQVAGLPIHQVYLGSCTNGRIEDFRVAASILKGNTIARSTRLVATPATRQVYQQGLAEGLWEAIVEAGGLVNSPGCGACPGVQTGLLADGDNCLSTMNRNFRGRMGNPNASIYLASPLTCAVSALAGCITDPRTVATQSPEPVTP